MIGGELGGRVQKFLGAIEFVVFESLQSFVHRFFCLGSEQRTCVVTESFAARIAFESDFFFGRYRNRNRDLFLSRTKTYGIRGNHVITKIVEYENGPPPGGAHLSGKTAHPVEFDGDERPDQLAGTFFDGDGKLRMIAANSPHIGGAILADYACRSPH